MATELSSIPELAEEENASLRLNMQRCAPAYLFANNSLSLISTGIAGYVQSREAFGYYLSQTKVQLGLAMLSALRQHRVQVYGNIRHALEHAALAAYALRSPEKITKDENGFSDSQPLRRKALKWVGEHYKEESKDIFGWKGFINDEWAHASIRHAYRTLKATDDTLTVVYESFMDIFDAQTVKADLIHIGSAADRCLRLIAAVNAKLDTNAIHFAHTLDEEGRVVHKLAQIAIRDFKAGEPQAAPVIGSPEAPP